MPRFLFPYSVGREDGPRWKEFGFGRRYRRCRPFKVRVANSALCDGRQYHAFIQTLTACARIRGVESGGMVRRSALSYVSEAFRRGGSSSDPVRSSQALHLAALLKRTQFIPATMHFKKCAKRQVSRKVRVNARPSWHSRTRRDRHISRAFGVLRADKDPRNRAVLPVARAALVHSSRVRLHGIGMLAIAVGALHIDATRRSKRYDKEDLRPIAAVSTRECERTKPRV